MATLTPVLHSDYLELAEPSEAWEKILARIPQEQRALAKVDDEAAARVVQSYQRAREELAADIDRRWANTFGSNVAPTIDERVRFVSSLETLDQLTARQTDLTNGNVGALQYAYDESVLRAIQHDSAQRAIMADQFPVLQHMDPFVPPPGIAEEIYVNKAVQDATRIAKATRDAAALQLTTAALKGEGPDAMRRRLTPVFDGNRRQAELTTRYVSIRAYNEASRVHYGQMQDVLAPFGRTVYTMWIATENDRTCPICLALHGSIVGVDQDFDLKATFDRKPPSPPWPDGSVLTEPPRHARCRCTIAPWVDGWENGTRFTPQAMQAEARRLAQKAGYSPTLRQPVRGHAPPLPSGPSWAATQIRQIPYEALQRVKTQYLACVYGDAPGLLSAHAAGPPSLQKHLDGR